MLINFGRLPVRRLTRHVSEGRYEEAYRLASDLRDRFGEKTPASIYYYGAASLFGLGHVHQAESWVEEHGRKDPSGVDHLYLKAFLYLHLGQPDQALLCWTRITQLDPSGRFADELIALAREGHDRLLEKAKPGDSFLDFIPVAVKKKKSGPENGLKKFFERNRLLVSRALLLAFLLFVLIGTLILFETEYFRMTPGITLPEPPARITLNHPESGLSPTSPVNYTSPGMALDEYELARKKVASGKVNQGRYLLNRIESSNAGFELKERARLMKDFIPILRREEFHDPVDYSTVLKEGAFYLGAQVLWKGRVLSVDQGRDGDSFLMEMIPGSPSVRVILNHGAGENPSLESGHLVEVFGIVQFIENRRPVLGVQEILLIPESQN